eukprot:3713783-Rhodomonas_salina.1
MPTWKLKDSWSCNGTAGGTVSRDAFDEWSSSWELSNSCTSALSGTREVRAEATGGCSVRRDHSTPPASDSEGSASALSRFQAIRVGCMATWCESGCVRRRSAWSNIQSGRAATLPRGTMPNAARTLLGPHIGSHTHLPACRPVCMQPSKAQSGKPGTARQAYRMQSTRARSSIPFWPVSSHTTGTGTTGNARTAHSCVASVESSSREIIIDARGR